MSMSQEEIEALMSESSDVAPVAEETPAVEEISTDDAPMSADDIASLVASSDVNESEEDSVEAEVSEEISDEDIFAEIDDITESSDESSADEVSSSDDNLDDVLAGIDGITDDEIVTAPADSTTEEDNFDDVLAGIEGVDSNDSAEDTLDDKIDQGVYPLPVEKEHKVVNQLNEVAEDSEEKATQIFDVLSFILDENNEIQKNVKTTGEFVEQQITLLEALSKKFPNVAVFSENLEVAKNLSNMSVETSGKIEEENNQIFNAMDLMQYHDINRQKIERVMSVIRKLSTYLNGIFEDDNDKPEVQIAKHISGDSSDTVSEDDLDSLIADFAN